MHLTTLHGSKRNTVSFDEDGNKTVKQVDVLHENRHLMPHLRGGVFPRQAAPGELARVRANIATKAERKAGLAWTR